MMGYKPPQINWGQMGQIGQNLGQGYQNRQQLPWARPGWSGAPQGAALMGYGRPVGGAMPTQAQGQPMQGGMNPLDMWNMLKQGRPIT
jgi:hypothetical protein